MVGDVAMIPFLVRLPRSLIEALDAQSLRSGVSRAVLARTLLQQGLGAGGDVGALREVLAYAGQRGLSAARLAELLGE